MYFYMYKKLIIANIKIITNKKITQKVLENAVLPRVLL